MVIQKTLLLLVLLFTLQLAVSCGDDCVCPGAETYEVDYREVNITPYNTAGFVARVVEDSVPKNAFGLEIQVDFDLTKISYQPVSLPAGFGYSYALACDCVGPEYVYPDSLDYLTIRMTDVATDEAQDVSSWFATYAGYGSDELISLEAFFQSRAEWHDGFRLELIKYDAVPRAAVFVVEAYLTSGKTFATQTIPIHFYDGS